MSSSSQTHGCTPSGKRRWVSFVVLLMVCGATLAVSSPTPSHAAETAFADVPADSIFVDDIAWLAARGITLGCNPPLNDRFCPTASVSRGAMASFLSRALTLPPSAVDVFVDDDLTVHEPDINRLAVAGLTFGCNPPDNDSYCPDATLTRGQLASFFVRAFNLPANSGDDFFADDDASVHGVDINALAAAGITLGCNPPERTRFCPEDPVSRQELAAFLRRASGTRAVSVGDIARCTLTSDEQTGVLAAELSEGGPILGLGDFAYPAGTAETFADCYAPSWGSLDEQMYPTPGNHDYFDEGAAGYYAYFGSRAGDPDRGYYSFEIDDHWHGVALNSNCIFVDNLCDPGGHQEVWFRNDLAEHAHKNVVVFWHHPRFTNNRYTDFETMAPYWDAAVEYGVDLVLTAHEHHYERYWPVDATGALDDDGVPQFIVGTGGTTLRTEEQLPATASAVRSFDDWGVLALDLRPYGYSWRFVGVSGTRWIDGGIGKLVDPG